MSIAITISCCTGSLLLRRFSSSRERGDPGISKPLTIELRAVGLERTKEPGIEEGLKMLPGAEVRPFVEVETRPWPRYRPRPRPRPRLGTLELATQEPDVLAIAILTRQKISVRHYMNDRSGMGEGGMARRN